MYPSHTTPTIPNYEHIKKLSDSVGLEPADLARIYWLSGTPCGGKTTVSDAIAKQLGWNVYHVDEQWNSHVERA